MQKLSCCELSDFVNIKFGQPEGIKFKVAIDRMIPEYFYLLLLTGIRKYNYGDPVTQTYRFDCNGGEGDTILIEDTKVDNVGHGISEVKVYENLVLGKLM